MDNVRGKILIKARKESSSSEEREQKFHTDDVLKVPYKRPKGIFLVRGTKAETPYW